MTTVNFNINARATGNWQAIRDGEKAVFQLKTQIGGVAALLKSGVLLKAGAELTAAFAAIPRGLTAAIASGVAFNANLEKQTLALKTLTGSLSVAKGRMAELVSFAAATPFQLPEVIAANRLLTTFGGTALATADTLRLVGDAAAAGGRGFEEAAMWIGRLYVGLKSGTPVGEATLRLLEMGVVTPEVKARLEGLAQTAQGHAGAQAALAEAFARTSGAMQEQAGTYLGLGSTLKDTLGLMQAEAFAPVFAALKDGLTGVLDALKAGGADPALRTFGQVVADLVKAGVGIVRWTIEWSSALGTLAAALAAAAVAMTVGHIATWTRSILAASAATQVFAVGASTNLTGATAVVRRMVFMVGQASGVTGKLAAAFRAAGLAMRAAFLGNPLGVILTAVTAIVAGLYLWRARQRAIAEEARKTREETDRLSQSWPARRDALDSEAARKQVILDLTAAIREIEGKPGRLTDAEREQLALLRSQVTEARSLTDADLARNRAAAEAVAQRQAELAALRENLAELGRARADDPRTAEMERIRSRLSALPPGAGYDLPAQAAALDAEEARLRAIERAARDAAEPLLAMAEASSFGMAVLDEQERALARSSVEAAAQAQASLEALDAERAQLAARAAQARERIELENRLRTLQREGALEAAADLQRLVRTEDALVQNRRDGLRAERERAEAAGDQGAVQRAIDAEKAAVAELAALYDDLAKSLAAVDPEAAAGAEGRAAGLRREGADLQPDRPATFGEGLASGAQGFLGSVGSSADVAAEAVRGGLNAALQSTSDILYNLASGSMTFSEAWGAATRAVGQQFLRMATDMVAKLIWKATVERALIAMGVTVHVAGESAKTTATLSGGAIRLAMALKEGLASVVKGALGAFQALSSIPYVGPILGAAAMAAALVGGMALLGRIGKMDGGYSADGPADRPAFIGHAGEWVAPQWMVKDPTYGPLISALEGARTGGGSGLAAVSPGARGGAAAASDGASGGPALQRTLTLTRERGRRDRHYRDDPSFKVEVVNVMREARA